jgi:hypothetical protein
MPSTLAVQISNSSSRVPMPPGSTRKASERASMTPLRSRMSAVTISSPESLSATSMSTSTWGITPTVWPPAARAAVVTAPMQETVAPPLTRVWPRRASSAPTSDARARYLSSMCWLEEQ